MWNCKGQTDSVRPIVPAAGGAWAVPPLDILIPLRPRIPYEYWPQIQMSCRAGATRQDLMAEWGVSYAVIRRIVTQNEGEAML